MATRAATYALARPIPYLLQQGGAQTIDFPVRHGATGALVAPTAAGSTVTIKRPAGTSFAAAQAVTVASSLASYDVASTAAEDVGDGWEVLLSLVIDGNTYPFRRNAYLCEYVPPCPISVADLYTAVPELRSQIPQAQDTNGTAEGWQPQIDAAYFEWLRELIGNGRKVWLLRSADDYFDRVLYRAAQMACDAVPAEEGSPWARLSKQMWRELERARGNVRLGYSDEAVKTRLGGSPQTILAPPGRVTC